MRQSFLIILFVLFPTILFSQGFIPQYNKNKKTNIPNSEILKRIPPNGKIMHYEVIGSDTIYLDNIRELRVIYIPHNAKKSKQWKEYYKLVWNFNKVYPYALIAKKITMEADSILKVSNFSKREREKYIKNYEKRLFKEFEKPLKNLTFSQGKLLLRLLDRELGQTSYYIIKGYKGGAAAGFWQGVAKLFGSDLKRPYDRVGADKEVEELVGMYHNGTFHYLYNSMYAK